MSDFSELVKIRRSAHREGQNTALSSPSNVNAVPFSSPRCDKSPFGLTNAIYSRLWRMTSSHQLGTWKTPTLTRRQKLARRAIDPLTRIAEAIYIIYSDSERPRIVNIFPSQVKDHTLNIVTTVACFRFFRPKVNYRISTVYRENCCGTSRIIIYEL